MDGRWKSRVCTYLQEPTNASNRSSCDKEVAQLQRINLPKGCRPRSAMEGASRIPVNIVHVDEDDDSLLALHDSRLPGREDKPRQFARRTPGRNTLFNYSSMGWVSRFRQ